MLTEKVSEPLDYHNIPPIMNIEVISAEPDFVLGLGSYNTYSDFDNQNLALHGIDYGRHSVDDFEASHATGSQSDRRNLQSCLEQMEGDAAMGELTPQSPNKVFEENVAASAVEQSKNHGSDTRHTEVQDHSKVQSNAGRGSCNNPDMSERSDLNSEGLSNERIPASHCSTPAKGSGTTPFPPGQRPKNAVTSSHYDGLPDSDQTHSRHSPASPATSSRTVNDHHTQSRMGMDILVHPNTSATTNGRQPLQHRSHFPGSGLRHSFVAGDSDTHPLPRSPGQHFDQDHVQDPFTTAQSPQGTHGHQHAMARGYAGRHPVQGSSGSDGGHSPYAGRGQMHHGQGYVYYQGSSPLQSRADSLPHLSQAYSQEIARRGSHHSNHEMSMLPQPAMQHFQPFGHNFEMHRNMSQQGYGSLKQEDSSPRSMASVPTLGGIGNENYTPPEERTLCDLEPNPCFEDREDNERLTKLQAAMMEMRKAEDNEGMKKTWVALSKDKQKVAQVCRKVLNACYISQHTSTPLQQSVKPQHHYETLDERVDAICEAFKQQKTMCKHLMEAPYLYQVVDDPNLAAMRVINNRKVNKGKKEAIEQGRKALKENRKPRAQSAGFKEEYDEDYEDDGLEEAFYQDDAETSVEPYGLLPYSAPTLNQGNYISKRGRPNVARQMSSDDSADLTYGVPPTKKAKKSTSIYQLNSRNEMIDMSSPGKGRRPSQPIARRAIQNRRSSHTYHPTLSDYNNSGTELESDNAAMGYGASYSEEDYQQGLL